MHRNQPSDSASRGRLGSSENRRAAALRNLGARQGTLRVARTRAASTPETRLSLSIPQLREVAALWVQSAEDGARSPRTIGEYRDLGRRLLWFLDRAGAAACGPEELRSFLAYVQHGHEEPGGRWENPQNAHNRRPVGLATLAAYHRDLKALFGFAVRQAALSANPLDSLTAPRPAPPVIETFSPAQFQALLRAARASYFPTRNLALLWFLADTGARVGEVAALRTRQVDIGNRRALVLGKGRKERILPFGPSTARALWAYRAEFGDALPEFFFVAGQGRFQEERLTENGLYQIVERLGVAAGIQGVRCSPHTWRHTFAVEFLRGGGGELALQEILGHASLKMVSVYARLARADIQERHRVASPAERLRRG